MRKEGVTPTRSQEEGAKGGGVYSWKIANQQNAIRYVLTQARAIGDNWDISRGALRNIRVTESAKNDLNGLVESIWQEEMSNAYPGIHVEVIPPGEYDCVCVLDLEQTIGSIQSELGYALSVRVAVSPGFWISHPWVWINYRYVQEENVIQSVERAIARGEHSVMGHLIHCYDLRHPNIDTFKHAVQCVRRVHTLLETLLTGARQIPLLQIGGVDTDYLRTNGWPEVVCCGPIQSKPGLLDSPSLLPVWAALPRVECGYHRVSLRAYRVNPHPPREDMKSKQRKNLWTLLKAQQGAHHCPTVESVVFTETALIHNTPAGHVMRFGKQFSPEGIQEQKDQDLAQKERGMLLDGEAKERHQIALEEQGARANLMNQWEPPERESEEWASELELKKMIFTEKERQNQKKRENRERSQQRKTMVLNTQDMPDPPSMDVEYFIVWHPSLPDVPLEDVEERRDQLSKLLGLEQLPTKLVWGTAFLGEWSRRDKFVVMEGVPYPVSRGMNHTERSQRQKQ